MLSLCSFDNDILDLPLTSRRIGSGYYNWRIDRIIYGCILPFSAALISMTLSFNLRKYVILLV